MSVAFSLLRCLLAGPASVSELRGALEGLRHYYPLRHANLYASLNELEDRGHVCSKPEPVDAAGSRVYTITAEGHAAFLEWLASPPETPLGEVHDPVHLRLVMATHDTSLFDWLSWVIPEVAAEAERAKEGYRRNRCEMTPLAQLAVEELVANLERRRCFLARALALARSQLLSEQESRAAPP